MIEHPTIPTIAPKNAHHDCPGSDHHDPEVPTDSSLALRVRSTDTVEGTYQLEPGTRSDRGRTSNRICFHDGIVLRVGSLRSSTVQSEGMQRFGGGTWHQASVPRPPAIVVVESDSISRYRSRTIMSDLLVHPSAACAGLSQQWFGSICLGRSAHARPVEEGVPSAIAVDHGHDPRIVTASPTRRIALS